MTMYKDEMDRILDSLNNSVNSTFDEYIAARIMYDIGRISIDERSDSEVISPVVGAEVKLEPITMVEIKAFKNRYPEFISNVFHGMLVQTWLDCLSDVFSLFIDLNMHCIKNFEGLKKMDFRLKLDFTQGDINAQIEKGLGNDFNFKEYSEKDKSINAVLDPSNTVQQDLQNIHKNVQLRNCIQHHQGCVDSFTLKKLGCTAIEILDNAGASQKLKEGDRNITSLPQIYSFKRSILTVIQSWRPIA
jgi:hypothetical protein